MGDDHRDLTGHWLGRYDGAGQSVPFEAELLEMGSSLTGETSEPNTFRDDCGPVLAATLSGGRVGHEVSLQKTYHGFDQERLVYDGATNAGLTRIEGRWYFPAYPGFDGRFVMMRKPRAGARAERRARVAVPVR